jgi:hypothetical protein
MSVSYTQGTWQVKPGGAEDLVGVRAEFADWTSRNVQGAGRATLERVVEVG